ncbi:GNAT family N-acetyltransferase [Kineococcus sp. LSe6-4]|uniref:GNAT family N-acetyltransferase n=1 Tax=Kineococcus halophytocola TaxID=3234027 RepID=A0ABV4GX32_9ACTN
MTVAELHEEPPGGPAGRFLRTAFWAETAAVTGLPLGGGAPRSDLTDLTAPHGAFVVAGERLGCVGVRFLPDGAAEVKRLFVTPQARGTGLGRRLLTWCEDWARDRGATRLVLDTHGTLTAARSLYLSAGFEEVAPYNDNPHAQLWFAKDLPPGALRHH